MINPLSLQNKRVLITGASSGIGRAVALLCSKLGADVILVARNKSKLEATKETLKNGVHNILPFDLSNIEDIEKMMNICIDCGSKLDGLVHAAGICPIVPIGNINKNKLLEIMNVNYFSFMELVKYYSKRKYSNGGSIVGISSVSSMVGWKGASIYCGSKGAMDSSIRALALELATKNIRVNSVVPSNIKTKMHDTFKEFTTSDFNDSIDMKQPLGVGTVDDVANAVAFLLSDAAKFITGTSLVVDGGYLSQ